MRLYPYKMDRILLLGQKSCTWGIRFKIYWMPKSIPTAKYQNFYWQTGVQKPTRAKFLEFRFFCLKRQGYINITRTKINLWSHHLHTKTVNVTFFLFLGSNISLLRQISSLSFQLSSGSFRSKCMRCILFKMYEACLLSTIHILIYL